LDTADLRHVVALDAARVPRWIIALEKNGLRNTNATQKQRAQNRQPLHRCREHTMAVTPPAAGSVPVRLKAVDWRASGAETRVMGTCVEGVVPVMGRVTERFSLEESQPIQKVSA